MWLSLACALPGIWPPTQVCALTGNRTNDLWFAGQYSIHWATPTRAPPLFLLLDLHPLCEWLHPATGLQVFIKGGNCSLILLSNLDVQKQPQIPLCTITLLVLLDSASWVRSIFFSWCLLTHLSTSPNPHPLPLASTNLFSESELWAAYHCSFYSGWNHTVCSLFRLASFTWLYAFKIPPCLFVAW